MKRKVFSLVFSCWFISSLCFSSALQANWRNYLSRWWNKPLLYKVNPVKDVPILAKPLTNVNPILLSMAQFVGIPDSLGMTYNAPKNELLWSRKSLCNYLFSKTAQLTTGPVTQNLIAKPVFNSFENYVEGASAKSASRSLVKSLVVNSLGYSLGFFNAPSRSRWVLNTAGLLALGVGVEYLDNKISSL